MNSTLISLGRRVASRGYDILTRVTRLREEDNEKKSTIQRASRVGDLTNGKWSKLCNGNYRIDLGHSQGDWAWDILNPWAWSLTPSRSSGFLNRKMGEVWYLSKWIRVGLTYNPRAEAHYSQMFLQFKQHVPCRRDSPESEIQPTHTEVPVIPMSNFKLKVQTFKLHSSTICPKFERTSIIQDLADPWWGADHWWRLMIALIIKNINWHPVNSGRVLCSTPTQCH